MLLTEMGCDVTVINDNTDGVFPHPIEPTENNLSDTLKLVGDGDFDIAFAHDGDADRTCAISGDGSLIEWDSFLTALSYGHKTVVTTVDASMRIEDMCDNVVRVPVGDVSVADGIRANNAGFGGEPSGTYIFPDIHIYPDGVATIAKTVKMVDEGVFYDLIDKIPSYPVVRLKLECPDSEKEKIMDSLENIISMDYTTIDGVRVQDEDCWMLIRPSGTEPYMRITAEARTREKLDEIVEKGKVWLKAAGLSL